MKWRKIIRVVSPLRTTGRFFGRHPWAICLLSFLLILYKYFFSWFTILVTTSPIFLISGTFLGIILAYGEANNPEKDHVYKTIERAHVRNVHTNGKSVGAAGLLRILSSEERVPKQENADNKIWKRSHSAGSSEEPGSSESTGSSDTDTAPMLHAFHHLRSANNSSNSSQDGDFSDSSMEDGIENQEHGIGNMSEEKEDGKAIAWTVDDQKNILKIGCLEIERNQRLESLIARRRTRNYADRSLIDFGISDSSPSVEELSKFNVQIPAVFAPRKNPFDLPYNEDNFPGSAPSVLVQTGNPFDLPCVQEDVTSSAGRASSSHEEPISVVSLLQKSALFRRHESFTNGAPFLSNFLQDARPSRLRPYFITEKMANEEMTSSSLEGETSEKGSSRASSIQDSDSCSSIMDQESQKDILEDCSNQEERLPFNPPEEQAHVAQHVRGVSLVLDMEPPVLISDSSDDDISLSGEHINDRVEAQHSENLNFPHYTFLEDLSVMQHHQEEMAHNSLYIMSPHSNDIEFTSTSSESTDNPFEVDEMESPAKEVVVTDDSHAPDPIYDSSPTGSEKPASIGLVINAAVLQYAHSHTSNAEARTEEECSSSTMDISSSEIAQSSSHSAEQGKLVEKETSESREHATVEHDEAHNRSVSHADTSISDISSQQTTENPTNVKSGSSIIESSKNAVFSFFQK